MSQRRRAAEQRGRLAEWIAAFWLMLKGYRILGHRLRTPFGEVDLAAWKGGALIIVEVKARSTYDAGAYAVHPQSQQRIARAAQVLAGRGSMRRPSGSISWWSARDGCRSMSGASGWMKCGVNCPEMIQCHARLHA